MNKNISNGRAVLVFLLLTPLPSGAAQFDCTDLRSRASFAFTHAVDVKDDFTVRDLLPETEAPKSFWKTQYGNFGPCPLTYPKVLTFQPGKITDWSRKRVIEVAKKYIGLPYKHFHIPAMGGLDCSNFASWVYNYGFGIRFTSNLKRQAFEAGRRLSPTESFAPGDLIFLFNSTHNEIVHVAVYVDEKNVIDSTGVEVGFRTFAGRYKTDFAWARRIIE